MMSSKRIICFNVRQKSLFFNRKEDPWHVRGVVSTKLKGYSIILYALVNSGSSEGMSTFMNKAG
jgi:hypothetical protein